MSLPQASDLAAALHGLTPTSTRVRDVLGRVHLEGVSVVDGGRAHDPGCAATPSLQSALHVDELGTLIWYAFATQRHAEGSGGRGGEDQLPGRELPTGFVHSDKMLEHKGPANHPERPDRLSAIYSRFKACGLLNAVAHIPPRPASVLELLSVHSQAHVDHIAETAEWFEEPDAGAGLTLVSGLASKLGYIQRGDCYYSAQTAACALLSCGSAVEVTYRVVRGELSNAFALVRPPGHHAERGKEMGFCFFNNAAVAAKMALSYGVRRVLILDWDVHHGNGTQNAFNETGEVLYISLHRYGGGFYPGTGGETECGTGPGEGYNLNIPWPETGTGDEDYRAAFDRVVMPVATAYAPELVIVSAGFDAAAGDPLGNMEVSPAGYQYMTQRLRELAGGRLVVMLEGGYNLDSISRSAEACMRELQARGSSSGHGGSGERVESGSKAAAKSSTAPLLADIRRRFVQYWPTIMVR